MGKWFSLATPDFQKGPRSFADIADVIHKMRDQQRANAQLSMQQERDKNTNAYNQGLLQQGKEGLAYKRERDAVTDKQAREKHVYESFLKGREALEKGDDGTAQFIGGQAGIDFARKQVQMPEAPRLQLQEPGDLQIKEQAAQGLLGLTGRLKRPDMLGPEQTPETQQFAQGMQQYGRDFADASKQGRMYTATLPGGRTIEIDPEAAAEKEREQKRLEFEASKANLDSVSAGLPEQVRAAMALNHMLGSTSMGNVEKQGTIGALSQAAAHSQQDKMFDKNAALQKELMRMRPRPTGGGGSGTKDLDRTKKELDVEGKYTLEVQKVLTNYGFKELNTQAVKFESLLDQIAGASDNAALNAIARGSFVKMSQGGVGVISDNDMRVFWDRIGGLGMRASEAWQGYKDGTLSPDKRKIVQSAIADMHAKARENVDSIGGAIETRLSGLPGGQERVPTFLKTYAPGYFDRYNAKRAKGGDQGAIDELDRQADQWLKEMR